MTIDGDALVGTIRELCSFGPRWMGSEGAARAQAFILEQFAAAGLETASEPFEYLLYTPTAASLQVAGRDVTCEPLAYGASTEPALGAPLLYAGDCGEADIGELRAQGADIGGSILVSDNLRSFVAYPVAEAAGARGFVLVTTLPDDTIRCGSVRLDRRLGTIPAVCIGGVDGRALIRMLGSGEVLEGRLDVRGTVEQRTGRNAVGRIPGRSGPRTLITAHYDSFWNGVHAMDNGSGVAGVIALARALPPVTSHALEFVVFGAEDLGLWGAAGYVDRHAQELSDIQAIVNLDNFGSVLSQLEVGVTQDLRPACEALAAGIALHVDCWHTPPRAGSDHHVFVERGVPSVWLANCGADPYYHTPLDVPDRMDPEALARSVRFGFELAKALAHG